MAEVTVTKVFQNYTPGVERALIEASDGETYTVQKIGQIWGAAISLNQDSAASDAATVTFTNGGTQATVNLTGSVTDIKCTIELYSD